MKLTDREKQVLQLAANGLSTPAIGGVLGLSESTTKSHLHNIYAKWGLLKSDKHPKVLAIVRAIKEGVIK